MRSLRFIALCFGIGFGIAAWTQTTAGFQMWQSFGGGRPIEPADVLIAMPIAIILGVAVMGGWK